ncbi:hypothetical protein [Geotalea sp. SG265]|uniref:hypothetical protein n=1 Tax=Geotalea sp. SG265 TaxID=2922867 RepID=UPI001FAF65EA|nr:hypothetical protein [Geotalea sp. SG265]
MSAPANTPIHKPSRWNPTAALEEALTKNSLSLADLFDRAYRPIPNSIPQKFTTRFDRFFDQAISPIQERIVAENDDIYFAICVDHGYCPSHNLRYTKPLTGDPDIDKGPTGPSGYSTTGPACGERRTRSLSSCRHTYGTPARS